MRIAGITDKAMPMNTLKSLPEALQQYRTKFLERYEKGELVPGVPSGFKDLDLRTTGFKKQDLIIIAARPSMGKTAFALNMALNMSKAGKSVYFAELEMSEESVVNRLVSAMGNVDGSRLSTGLVTDEEYEKVWAAMEELERFHKTLMIDTLPGVSVAEIKAKARKIKRERGLDCVIVDYLGLIASPGLTNRYDIVSENTRMLKNMARELDCPVIVLCQLSRAVEQRQDKRPMLSDLRESGEIEQTADLVLFLYRDDYYDEHSEKKNIAEVIIGKQRNGPLGKIDLLFVKDYNKFLPLDLRGDRR
jgi:replicative DNA helicase